MRAGGHDAGSFRGDSLATSGPSRMASRGFSDARIIRLTSGIPASADTIVDARISGQSPPRDSIHAVDGQALTATYTFAAAQRPNRPAVTQSAATSSIFGPDSPWQGEYLGNGTHRGIKGD